MAHRSVRHRALACLSSADIPAKWRPYAELLKEGAVPALWKDLRRCEWTDGELRCLFHIVLKAAHDCSVRDPRPDLQRLAGLAAKAHAQAMELRATLMQMDDLSVHCPGTHYDAINLDRAWSGDDVWAPYGAQSMLADIMGVGGHLGILAKRELNRQTLASRFCVAIDRLVHWHAMIDRDTRYPRSLPAGFWLAPSAKADLVRALFGVTMQRGRAGQL